MNQFNQMVLDRLQEDRSRGLVVDNCHAYARIAQRLRYLWDGICLLGEEQLEKDGVLSCLVGISSMSQHCAESLELVSTEEIQAKEPISPNEKVSQYEQLLDGVLACLIGRKQQIAAHQLGNNRYAFEFDDRWLETLQQRMAELKDG